MAAAEMWDDQVFVGSENSCNIFTVRASLESATPEQTQRLETIGEYHLGEFVNKFRPGSLVLKIPDSTSVCMYPSMLFVTVSGSIGMLIKLPEDVFEKLGKLQSNMTKLVKPIGG